MKITMQKGASPSELHHSGWDIGIVGTAVDTRGKAAESFIAATTQNVVPMVYDEEEYQINLNGESINAEEVNDYFERVRDKSLILETTTLGFVEIFLSCRALKSLGVAQASLLYVEPLEYTRPVRSQLLHKRDFTLSGDVPGFRAIPSAAFILDDRKPQKAVFFLGYEERRLDRAMEDFPLRPSLCATVFGVPAFQPGWEMDAFANNIRVIRSRDIAGGVHFCGAENPKAAAEVLARIYAERGPDEKLFIAPIGTKPHGIGAALFAATHPDVGILYDHPRRKAGRSSATAAWHLFTVTF